MKDFFCTHFSIRIVFLITHAWKQEFPHPRSSQYPLQKYLKCFTVYSTSAHYRYDNSMKYFFCTHFLIRIVFLIIHACKQEFPHLRSSQYLLQKYLRCFTLYSPSAHYRYDFRENTLLQKPHKICRVLKRLCCTASTGFNLCFQPSVFCWCVASGKPFCPSLSLWEISALFSWGGR